jgi:serine phosphatase RsbU (regulator of sigma subunit)
MGIAVGDVEGHGFGSALVMALTRAYVHSFAAMGLEVDEILTQVNQMLVKDLGSRCFLTLMLASLDLGADPSSMPAPDMFRDTFSAPLEPWNIR